MFEMGVIRAILKLCSMSLLIVKQYIRYYETINAVIVNIRTKVATQHRQRSLSRADNH